MLFKNSNFHQNLMLLIYLKRSPRLFLTGLFLVVSLNRPWHFSLCASLSGSAKNAGKIVGLRNQLCNHMYRMTTITCCLDISYHTIHIHHVHILYYLEVNSPLARKIEREYPGTNIHFQKTTFSLHFVFLFRLIEMMCFRKRGFFDTSYTISKLRLTYLL